jgi:predicted RNA-binding protein with PUA-like domain
MQYWLIKSEPNDYSIQDLKTDHQAIWDGVRNYQARNFLRQMQEGELTFYYHSNTKTPGIVGLAKVIQANVTDPTQFDSNSHYYDPKSTPEQPRWQTVEIEFVELFPEMIPLTTLKQEFTGDEFHLVRKGNRLSVIPVPDKIAQRILAIKTAV